MLNLSFPGGGFFGGAPAMPAVAAPIPAPEPKPTRTKPQADIDEEVRKRRVAAAQQASGRASTVLAEVGTGEKLGA